MSKAKVSFNIIIPNEVDIGEVMVYKYKDDQREVMFSDDVEDFSDEDDDEDYLPGIDEDEYSDEEADIYEDTPLSEKEKAELQEELENLIADQELDIEWEQYKNKD